MRVELVRVEDLDARSVQRWNAIRDGSRSLASPFFSPDFIRVAARLRPCRIAIIEADGATVGFWPFEHRRFGLSRPVAAPITDHHGPVVSPDLVLPPTELLRRCGMLGYQFNALPADQRLFQPFHGATQASPIVCVERTELSNQSRKRNGLERERGPVRFELDCRDSRVLDTLIAWKRAQCARTQYPDFTQEPWTVALLHALHENPSPGMRPWLSVLWAGDDPVAAHFGLASARAWHWWVAAYDFECSRYSPGLLMLHEMVRAARTMGIEWLDFGTGEQPFKQQFANDALQVASGTVFTTVGRVAFALSQRVKALRRPASRAAG